MSGNIWEWCYEDSEQEHVMRGGSWRDSSSYLQIGNASDFPRSDPVTPKNLWDLSPSEYVNDLNYYGINLTDTSPIPGIGKTPLQWLIDKHGYNPTVPVLLGGDFIRYDPTLDPNLASLASLGAYIRTYDPTYPDPPTSDAVAKSDYFGHFGNSGFTVSGFPYNQDYATRYDPRFDSRNPDYPLYDTARDVYDKDASRMGGTIGFRIIRNQTSF
jgi:hypothetical protein